MGKKCAVKHCRKEPTMTYYDHDICESCWDKHCDKEINLKKMFKIPEIEFGSPVKESQATLAEIAPRARKNK